MVFKHSVFVVLVKHSVFMVWYLVKHRDSFTFIKLFYVHSANKTQLATNLVINVTPGMQYVHFLSFQG